MSHISPEAQQEWDKVKDSVRLLAFRILKSPDEAEDVLNTVYYIVTRAYDKGKQFSSLRAYAQETAKNQSFKIISSRLPWSPLPDSDIVTDDDDDKDNGYNPLSPDRPEQPTDEIRTVTDETFSLKKVIENVLEKALEEDYINKQEYSVVTNRLELHEFTWQQIADKLGLSATNCMAIHSRTLSKLRIYLFSKCPNLLGGLTRIKSTFEYVVQNNSDFLQPAEVVAFRQAIFLRRKLPGSTGALQSACDKLISKFFFDPV